MPTAHTIRKGFVHLPLVALLVAGAIAAVFISKPKTHAAGSVNLTVVPRVTTVSQGQTFEADIFATPNGTTISAAELRIVFNSQRLEAVSATPIIAGSALPRVLPNCTNNTHPDCPISSAVKSNVVTMMIGINCPTTTSCTYPSSNQQLLLGTITLRAKTGSTGNARIELRLPTTTTGSGTRISGLGTGAENQVGTISNATVVVQ